MLFQPLCRVSKPPPLPRRPHRLTPSRRGTMGFMDRLAHSPLGLRPAQHDPHARFPREQPLQMKGGEGVLAVLAHYGREGLAGCRIARLELHDRPRSARSRPGPRRGARRLAAYSDLRPKKQLLLNQLSPVAYFSRYDPKGACTSVRSPPRTKNRAYSLYAYTH